MFPDVREERAINTASIEQTALRRGWCPTATRPMDASDGDLIRIRPYLACLDAKALAALAEIADRFADGHVLLTRRAKIELRGIQRSEAAAAALSAAGLLESPDYSGLPDRLVTPMSALDGEADAGVAALAHAIDSRLLQMETGGRLSSKFAVAIDGGGKAHLGRIEADIRLDSVPAKPGYWRLALGSDAVTARAVGELAEADVPEAVAGLIERFLQMPASVRRVRDLSSWQLQSMVRPVADRLSTPVADENLARPAAIALGLQDDNWQAAGFAFGRVGSRALRTLAELVRGTAAGAVGITPDRTVILGRGDEQAQQTLRGLGAIVDAADPRWPVAACVGNNGCLRGSTDTRSDALLGADVIPALRAAADGLALHVSGCPKGCARRSPAAVTLVGREGRYDVVFDAGPADQPVWRGLAMDEVIRRLQRLDRAFAGQGLPAESAEAFFRRLGEPGINHLIEESR